jgi:hypothetical protein
MEVSGSERGGPASVVATGLRCKPELISALKPRPKFLDGLLIAECYLSGDSAKSTKSDSTTRLSSRFQKCSTENRHLFLTSLTL